MFDFQERKIQQAKEEIQKGNFREFKTTPFELIVVIGDNRAITIPAGDYSEARRLRDELKKYLNEAR